MAAIIGRLGVSLDLNSATFTKKLKKATKETGGFWKKFRAGAAVGASGMALLGTAAIGAAAGAEALTAKIADSFDPIGKMSDRLGIAAESLQELHYAAEQSGVSTQQLDSGLGRMTRRIEFFERGSGAAAKALNELGFAQDELTNLGTEEQFNRITEALAGVESEGRRSALAFEIFGASGQAMLPMISGGVEGLNEMRARAQALGHTLDRQAIAGLEMFNDSLDDSSKTMQGFGNHLAAELAPSLTAMNRIFTDSIQEMGGMKKISEAVGKVIVKSFTLVVDGVGRAQLVLKLFQEGMQKAYIKVLEFSNNVGAPFAKVAQYMRKYLIDMVADVIKGFSTLLDYFGIEFAEGMAEFSKKIKENQPESFLTSDELLVQEKKRLLELKAEREKLVEEQGKYSKKVKEGAEQAIKDAEEVAKNATKKKSIGGGDESDAGKSDPKVEATKRQGREVLEELNRQSMSESERRRADHEAKVSQLEEFAEVDVEKREEYNERIRELNDTFDEENREIQAQQQEEQLDSAINAAEQMFGINKLSTLKQAALSMQANIARASEIGFPQNLVTIAGAIAQGVGIVSTIKGIAHAGLPRVPSEGTYILDKDEAVLSKKEADSYRRGELGGGISVTVNPVINSQGLNNETETQLIDRLTMRIVNDIRSNGLIGRTIRSI